MCLAIPGQIVAVDSDNPVQPVAKVDFEGVVKTVSLLYVPEAQVGDYVIVQSGFAIRRVDRAEAVEALTIARQTMMDGTKAPDAPASLPVIGGET